MENIMKKYLVTTVLAMMAAFAFATCGGDTGSCDAGCDTDTDSDSDSDSDSDVDTDTDSDTDTDTEGDAGTQLYSLDDNFPSTMSAVLAIDETGSIGIHLFYAFPETDTASLIALLTDGTFGIVVQNDETLSSYNLADGTFVYDVPSAAGEYSLSWDEMHTFVTVSFFNQTTTGASLQAGSQYTVNFAITANYFFEAEIFSRPMTVQ
jgi:hypothetical protein